MSLSIINLKLTINAYLLRMNGHLLRLHRCFFHHRCYSFRLNFGWMSRYCNFRKNYFCLMRNCYCCMIHLNCCYSLWMVAYSMSYYSLLKKNCSHWKNGFRLRLKNLVELHCLTKVLSNYYLHSNCSVLAML